MSSVEHLPCTLNIKILPNATDSVKSWIRMETEKNLTSLCIPVQSGLHHQFTVQILQVQTLFMFDKQSPWPIYAGQSEP